MSDTASWPVVPPPAWDNIPVELAERAQWLIWKYEKNTRSKDPNAKPLKMPYYVSGGRRTGDQGTERDRKRLVTLDVARKAFERGGWTGVGFTFLEGDGLIGIDIDGAIDKETGEVSAMCLGIVQACDSYTEISPSGTGLHIIVKGETHINKFDPIGLELYCGRLYFAFTGRRWPGTAKDVAQISDKTLGRLHTTIDKAKEAERAAKAAKSTPPPARPIAGSTGAAGDDFRRVNDAAMANFASWVPTVFPGAIARGDRYRISSRELGRDNQEDLSIEPRGIVDWGVWDMGDPREGKRTPIDLVMEWTPHKKPKEALHWLAQLVGVDVEERKPAQRKPKEPRPTLRAGAGGDSSGSQGGGGGGEPPDESSPVVGSEGGDWSLLRNRDKPLDCRENVLYALRHDAELAGLVAYNQFTELQERTRPTPWGREPGEWDDEDDLMLGEYLARTYGLLNKGTTTLRAGVQMAARELKFNPVVDLIRSEKWDGTPRLETWLTDVYEIDERPYTRLIGKCFIMGMVQRAIRPGCKFDYMLIIKGEQGLQKSGAFRELASPWFTDNAIRMGDKDSLMAMQLVWLAESSELESLNKAETTQIKQFLSAQEDLYRPPYGARMVKRPRHSVNVGTTNQDTFLKDATGDRRFWPLEVKVVNLDVIRNMRAQLFAEALVLLEKGERYWPSREEERALVFPEQERYKMSDVWEDILSLYVSRTHTNAKLDDAAELAPARRAFFSTQELFEKALAIKADRIDGNKIMETRVGNCMRALGFSRYRETGGARLRGYLRDGCEYGKPVPIAAPAPSSPATPPPTGADDVPL